MNFLNAFLLLLILPIFGGYVGATPLKNTSAQLFFKNLMFASPGPMLFLGLSLTIAYWPMAIISIPVLYLVGLLVAIAVRGLVRKLERQFPGS